MVYKYQAMEEHSRKMEEKEKKLQTELMSSHKTITIREHEVTCELYII